VPPDDPETGENDLSRLHDVRRRIAEAELAAGRSPGCVRLLLATKTIPAQRILAVIADGHRLIGENRVQELVAKAPDLAGADYESHLIGHLQANKINQVLPHVACIQTVDSADLATRLDTRVAVLDRTLDVLLQVNVSGEPTKSGVTLQELPGLLSEVGGLRHLRIRGYMTIGLNSPDLAAVRGGYHSLTEFRDRAQSKGFDGAELAVELSMGMSGDFVEAIGEGASIVRLGSAVFGRRPTPTG
jgi:pyridoxal phosphate enzyme (YggS family)